jgi:DNA-binding NarL/FixJ family response regulator
MTAVRQDRQGTSGNDHPEIRVAIVEDQRDIREGLALLIGGARGFACTGSYASMEEAIPRLRASPPDVVLADIGLPGMTGIEGIRLIKEKQPELVALVLSVFEDDRRIFDALCAGASGYLLKKTPPKRLLEGIREVVSGGAPMSPEVATRVVDLFRKVRPPESADYRLTPHETRLLQLLVEGHQYKTAADVLGITVRTVNFHVQQVYRKLQVHSKSEAVAKAIRNRIVS